ncbi:hypothetical protein FRB90_002398 [Tulasnella sp. 427]|nr:hypothetical protein FRB90_002398 [Tulasnella sp. 427]
MKYTVEGEFGTSIVVSAFSNSRDSPTVFVFELALSFQSTEWSTEVPKIVQTDLTSFSVNRIRHFARVLVQDGLCVAWYSPSSGSTNVIATVVDYRQGKRFDLETNIEATRETRDIQACIGNGSLLFYRDRLTSTVIDAYFDVTHYLQSVAPDSRPGDIQTVHKPPDASAVLSLQLPDPASRAHGEPRWGWTSVRTANTPHSSSPRGSASIFSYAIQMPGTRVIDPRISARWMDPRTTLETLKMETRMDTQIPRTWIDLDGPTGRRKWDWFGFMVASTYGHRVLWVSHRKDVQPGQTDGSAEQALFLIPLLTPDGTPRGAAGKRILELPIPLGDRLVAMDFSDELGTLVVAWKPGEDADGDEPMESSADHVLHIFQY